MKPFLAIAIIILVGLTSCEDFCKGVDCVNGDCSEGICICQQGYEKDSAHICSIRSRERFLGNYSVSQDCKTDLFDAEIIEDNNVARVRITRFSNVFNLNVIADVQRDTLHIALQNPDSDTKSVSGIGFYQKGNTPADDRVRIEYTVTLSNGQTLTCTDIFKRI